MTTFRMSNPRIRQQVVLAINDKGDATKIVALPYTTSSPKECELLRRLRGVVETEDAPPAPDDPQGDGVTPAESGASDSRAAATSTARRGTATRLP